jgi:hypothetical protein
MKLDKIEADFKRKVCEQIRLMPEGRERFRVFTPFRMDDGDLLALVLKRDGDGWGLTDEGNSFMRLTYAMDEKTIFQGNRKTVIEGALKGYGVEDRDGVLWSPVDGEAYGDALFSLIQASLRIMDVQLWSQTAVRHTFIADLRELVKQTVPEPLLTLDWTDPVTDPKGQYPVDFRIEPADRPPLFLFGIHSDTKCSLATIVIQHYRMANVPFTSLAVFEDQERIGRKALARLSDVVDGQFSNLPANRKAITQRLGEYAMAT